MSKDDDFMALVEDLADAITAEAEAEERYKEARAEYGRAGMEAQAARNRVSRALEAVSEHARTDYSKYALVRKLIY